MKPMRCSLATALLAVGALLVWGAPAAAQVTLAPDTVAVSLAAGESAEVTLGVTDAGGDSTRAFALALAPAPQPGDPPEPPGTLLFATTPDAVRFNVEDLTMTPEGQLFVAEDVGRNETSEFTAALDFVQKFAHPTTTNQSGTLGIAYDGDGSSTGTMWWLDNQIEPGIGGGYLLESLLLEGTLDGTATGRSLAVPFADDGLCGFSSGFPANPAYESVPQAEGAARFYYLDVWNFTIWAIDTLGAVVDGYPVPMTGYAGVPRPPDNPEGCLIISSLDAHALGGEAVFEVLTGIPFEHPQNRATRVVVTDRAGRNRGAETPLFDLVPPDGFGAVWRLRGVVRSRLDPSILYLTVKTGTFGDFRNWVYAVRAAPLPPRWLHGSPILFETEGTAATELVLSLDASGLEPGTYEAVASIRAGDGIGPVLVEVPVVLTVRPPVSSEDEAAELEAVALGAPYPNPSSGSVVVPLVLGTATEARVVVFDVLGRRVATLAEGHLEAGRHDLALDAAVLPAGVYLVRATSDGFTASWRLTLVR